MTEFASRYEALGVPIPDPATMCRGGCQGTGVYPVKKCEWGDEYERQAWHEAEREHPNSNGDEWHFVRCPVCCGTGRASQ